MTVTYQRTMRFERLDPARREVEMVGGAVPASSPTADLLASGGLVDAVSTLWRRLEGRPATSG